MNIEFTSDQRSLLLMALNVAIAREERKDGIASIADQYRDLLKYIAGTKCGDPWCSYCGERRDELYCEEDTDEQ